jgi:histidine ammonia-lyase
VFSRSTECHNQDKVSMGTIAARDCQRVLTLTEQVLAAAMLAGWQGVQLRLRAGELRTTDIQRRVRDCMETTGQFFSLVEQDVELEDSLQQAMEHVRQRKWVLYG